MGKLATQQRVEVNELPDPVEQLKYLAPAVVEILEGVRGVNQLAGLVTEEIFQRIKARSTTIARDRFSSSVRKPWPNIKVTRLHHEYTRDDLVQAVILLTTGNRTRAVAVRLEGRNRRWLATAITVL